MNRIEKRTQRLLPLLTAVATSLSACWMASANVLDDTRFMRVTEAEDISRLDVAIRHYKPADGRGPTIALVSAVHIGDLDYYRQLQTFMDDCDLVLYEGVKPADYDGGKPGTDEAHKARTQRRMEQLALALHRHQRFHRQFPESLDALHQNIARNNPILAEKISISKRDAWDNPIQYSRADNSFTLTSRGADGQPGGDGLDADIILDAAGTIELVDESAGIQKDMAQALGLAFQLEAIIYDRPHYRNSDMSMEQLQQRIGAGGGDPQELLGALDGSNAMASIAQVALGLIQANPQMQAMFKLLMLDLLPMAEEGLLQSQAVPPQMRQMMKVLLDERNVVVMDDIKTVLAKDDPPASIAVFYGAGHMQDLHQQIVEDLGYVAADVQWVPAIHVDIGATGMDRQQLNMMRNLIRQQLQNMSQQ